MRKKALRIVSPAPPEEIDNLLSSLKATDRYRRSVIKLRISAKNQLEAAIASSIGYSSLLDETQRGKLFSEARSIISEVAAGVLEHPYKELIMLRTVDYEKCDLLQDSLELQMANDVRRLGPIADWCEDKERRGFSVLRLATILGESGNLWNFPSEQHLHSFFGLTSICKKKDDGTFVCHKASWWKRIGGLTAEDWIAAKRCPRRHTTIYVIEDVLMKSNAVTVGGVKTPLRYRLEYDKTREWCKTNWPDSPDMRHHRHALTMLGKRLLTDLWHAWRKLVPKMPKMVSVQQAG